MGWFTHAKSLCASQCPSGVFDYDHVLSAAIQDELGRPNERVPTVSFTWKGHHSREIAATLGEQGIFAGTATAMRWPSPSGWAWKARAGWCASARCMTTRRRKSAVWVMRCGRWCSSCRGLTMHSNLCYTACIGDSAYIF